MIQKTRALLLVILGGGAILVGMVAVLGSLSILAINKTESMPLGLYIRSSDAVTVGSIVWVKPLWAGDIDRLKYVLGSVDQVSINASGEIRAFGLEWGRVVVPFIAGVHKETFPRFGRWFLWAPHPRSNDSRYFGAVPGDRILGVYRPLLTIGDPTRLQKFIEALNED